MPIARNSKHSGNRSIHPVSVQARRAGSSEKAQLSSNFGRMQTAKVKAKDMASSAKEKVKEGSAKMQGKMGEATAATHGEKEMAKESARAKKDQANAEKHQEKAEHRADATTGRHGTGVPLTGAHGHHGATGTATYPAASDKYL